MTGFFFICVTTFCKHDIAMSGEEVFQVMTCDFWLVSRTGLCGGVELFSVGGLGYVYFVMGSLKLNASIRSCLGKYKNVSCMF